MFIKTVKELNPKQGRPEGNSNALKFVIVSMFFGLASLNLLTEVLQWLVEQF